MFTHLLPESILLFKVIIEEYANSHFLKNFAKKYPGKQWLLTRESIFMDLSRLRMRNNTTQRSGQIDELLYKDSCWLAKYDFKIAGTKESPKTSGNRIALFINNEENYISILLAYNKTDLPKNKSETSFIMDTIEESYPKIYSLFYK